MPCTHQAPTQKSVFLFSIAQYAPYTLSDCIFGLLVKSCIVDLSFSKQISAFFLVFWSLNEIPLLEVNSLSKQTLFVFADCKL